MMAGEPDQVVVTGDDPQFILFVPVDWILLPQPPIISVRISDDLWGKHIIVNGSNHKRQLPPTEISSSDTRLFRNKCPGFLLDAMMISSICNLLILYSLWHKKCS